MTAIDYDTEFLEDGHTIDLISIALVADEDEGRELYLINADCDMGRVVRHPWLLANVVPSLPVRWPAGVDPQEQPGAWEWDRSHPDYDLVIGRSAVAAAVSGFIGAIDEPELWAWFGAFDHVALAWLFGPMVDLPPHIPMFTNDIRQEHRRLGEPLLPAQPSGVHNALADARHNCVRRQFLAQIAGGAR